MTNTKKIEEAEKLIARANKLLEEVKSDKVELGDDVLTQYKKALNKNAYWFNSQGKIVYSSTGLPFDNNAKAYDVFQNYPTEEFAEQAKEMRGFNDKLLAFRWCYDKDYEPKFDCKSRSHYCVYYDAENKRFDWNWTDLCMFNTVYFSAKEIAQKCCEWLNSISERFDEGVIWLSLQ